MAIFNKCFTICSTRTCTLILGMEVLIAFLILDLIIIYYLAYWEDSTQNWRKMIESEGRDSCEIMNSLHTGFIAFLIVFPVIIVAVCMLIQGVRKSRPGLMVPFILLHALVNVLAPIGFLVHVFSGELSVHTFLLFLLGVSGSFYSFLVVYSHYQELTYGDGAAEACVQAKKES